MAIWDDIVTERDKLVFKEGGFTTRIRKEKNGLLQEPQRVY